MKVTEKIKATINPHTIDRRVRWLELRTLQAAKTGLVVGDALRQVLPGKSFFMPAAIEVLEGRIAVARVGAEDLLLRQEAAEIARGVFETFFNHSPIPQYALTLDGNFKEVSAGLVALLGYQRHELINQSFTKILHPDERRDAMQRFWRRVDGKNVPSKERKYVTKDGRELSIITFTEVLKDAENRATGILTSFQSLDMLRTVQTRLLATERALMRRKHEAVVGQMAGNMAHVIKNKLLAIAVRNLELQQQFALLLAQVRVFSRAKQTTDLSNDKGFMQIGSELSCVMAGVSQIMEEVQDMDRVVRRLLAFARVGSEEHKIVSVRADINRTMGFLQTFAKEHGVGLRVEIEGIEETDGILIAEYALRDLIENLVINAIEAHADNKSGDIKAEKLVAVRVSRVNDNKQIRFEFEDNAGGIPPDRLAKLLIGPIEASKQNGTGFGLSIVKKEVEAAGGEIGVASTLGKGTKFTAEFKRADYLPGTKDKAPPVEKAGLDKTAVAKLRIMLVDDEEGSLEFLKIAVKRMGFVLIEQHGSAETALAAYKTAAIKPDILVTDLNMPKMNGTELIQAIAMEQGEGNLPLIVIHSGTTYPRRPIHTALLGVMQRYGVALLQKEADLNFLQNRLAEILTTKWGKLSGEGVPGREKLGVKKSPHSRFAIRIAELLDNYLATIVDHITVLMAHDHKESRSFETSESIATLSENLDQLIGLINNLAQVTEPGEAALAGFFAEDTETKNILTTGNETEKARAKIAAGCIVDHGLLFLKDQLIASINQGKIGQTLTAKNLAETREAVQRIRQLLDAVRLFEDTDGAKIFQSAYTLLEEIGAST